MTLLTNHPPLIFALSLGVLWLCAWIGSARLRKRKQLTDASREDFSVILAASLTLLGLIIGFTFSMAITRFDQRKTLEEAEANAIGTEYLRADLLADTDGAQIRILLKRYLAQRIEFYSAKAPQEPHRLDADTASLQHDLWSAIVAPARNAPNPSIALVVSGMNDVLNSQGYTEAAWWNRVPVAAWVLMGSIGILCNIMVGYVARTLESNSVLLAILPAVLSTAFFLIADIDSPRGGLIHVNAQNLLSLQEALP